MDALASCVTGMRPADVDEAELVMLDQLTSSAFARELVGQAIRANFQAIPALSHHNKGPCATGAVRSAPHNLRLGDFMIKNVADITKFKAIKALGDSRKTLSDDNLSAAGALHPVPHNRRSSDFSIKPLADPRLHHRLSDYNSKHAASCPNVLGVQQRTPDR